MPRRTLTVDQGGQCLDPCAVRKWVMIKSSRDIVNAIKKPDNTPGFMIARLPVLLYRTCAQVQNC